MPGTKSGKQRLIANQYKQTFWSDISVLKRIVAMLHNCINLLKLIELCTFIKVNFTICKSYPNKMCFKRAVTKRKSTSH